MSTHESLQLLETKKPIIILDNKTLAEVKQEVQEYSSKLAETIEAIEKQASIYELEAARKALHETIKEEYDNVQGFLQQIIVKLDKINPNAELEREVLTKLNAQL